MMVKLHSHYSALYFTGFVFLVAVVLLGSGADAVAPIRWLSRGQIPLGLPGGVRSAELVSG